MAPELSLTSPTIVSSNRCLTTSPKQLHPLRCPPPKHKSSFHPHYPAPEPLASPPTSNPFGRSFGVICYDSHPSLPTIRSAHPVEFAAFYSINPSLSPDIQHTLLPTLHLPLSTTAPLFLTTIPGSTATALAACLSSILFSPNSTHIANPAENILSCLIQPQNPIHSDWTEAYAADTVLQPILSALTSDPNHTFSEKILRNLPSSYSTPLRDHLISIRNNCLMYTQPLNSSGRCLLLIIPPESLRHRLFEILHSSPAAGHLMTHKTLHRI